MTMKVEIDNITLYPPYCKIHKKQFSLEYGTNKWFCSTCHKTIELIVKNAR